MGPADVGVLPAPPHRPASRLRSGSGGRRRDRRPAPRPPPCGRRGGGGGAGSLLPWIALLAGLGAIRFGASFTRRYRSGRLSLGVQYDLRNDTFAALLRLGGAQQDDLRTGQVVSRSISDITLIQTLLQFLPNLTGNVLMFLVSLVVMAVLSPC